MRTPRLSTHSGKLERWLGKESVETISKSMARWYGKPIAIGGVPGQVYVGRDGDFQGRIYSGLEISARDVIDSVGRRVRRAANNQLSQVNSGFSSIADLVAAAATAKKRRFPFYKVGPGGTTAGSSSLWGVGNLPAAGAAASAAPGGRVPDNTTTGAFPFTNPTGGRTQHMAASYTVSSVVNTTLLLYDRIFDVAKTMSSSVTEAVTGVPTRYQNTTAGTIDSAENNFVFIEVQTGLAAVAHNWTTCLYTNQAGTTGQTLQSVTGTSGQAAGKMDMPLGLWFAPLGTGDNGILALTQMQCSVATVTGAINFGIGHPIAWIPCPVITTLCIYDGVSSAFNLERIFDNACLAFLEPPRPTTTAATYQGQFFTVSN